MGLDISPSGVRLVELSRNRGGCHVLEHCAVEALEPGWIVDGRVEQFDSVAEVLQRLLRRVKTRTVNVAMALPAAAVITRKISLPAGRPATDRLELDARVRAEAGLAIPLPLQDVHLDYSVMSAAPGQAGQLQPSLAAAQADEKAQVLLVATRRERVQDLQGLAEAAGLEPVIVDVESYAARRAARRLIECLAQDEPRMAGEAEAVRVAMFEFGAHSTRLQILQGDEVIHERDHPFGTAAPTDMAQMARDMAGALDFFQAG
ncbi:type IV pilus assembly protein PilM, partial [Leptospira sp. SA-E8]|uniref:type IV pilus assembly protein PilM n=1 Tax=Leptospira sp. SA-E8 TaxID=3422259 RepID=UPI003EB7C161